MAEETKYPVAGGGALSASAAGSESSATLTSAHVPAVNSGSSAAASNDMAAARATAAEVASIGAESTASRSAGLNGAGDSQTDAAAASSSAAAPAAAGAAPPLSIASVVPSHSDYSVVGGTSLADGDVVLYTEITATAKQLTIAPGASVEVAGMPHLQDGTYLVVAVLDRKYSSGRRMSVLVARRGGKTKLIDASRVTGLAAEPLPPLGAQKMTDLLNRYAESIVENKAGKATATAGASAEAGGASAPTSRRARAKPLAKAQANRPLRPSARPVLSPHRTHCSPHSARACMRIACFR